MNLISNDGQRLAEMIQFTGILAALPPMMLCVTIFLTLYIGWTALIGIVVFLLFVPFQVGMEFIMV